MDGWNDRRPVFLHVCPTVPFLKYFKKGRVGVTKRLTGTNNVLPWTTHSKLSVIKPHILNCLSCDMWVVLNNRLPLMDCAYLQDKGSGADLLWWINNRGLEWPELSPLRYQAFAEHPCKDNPNLSFALTSNLQQLMFCETDSHAFHLTTRTQRNQLHVTQHWIRLSPLHCWTTSVVTMSSKWRVW